jgi:type IV pilus assembly protein PilC
MLFSYQALDRTGADKDGSIDAVTMDVAISSLQRRGYTIVSIEPAEKKGLLQTELTLFSGVSGKELVILSRQIATLFEAQVSALRIFRLLEEEVENVVLRRTLHEVSNDLQSGSSISGALAKHSKVFSPFYVNMVKAGEETGKLDETFMYLADYLDRTYEVASKARNALIYPAFIIATFVTVMILMLTLVIPKISAILLESGSEVPIYTKIVVAISNFFINYGIFLLVLLIIGGFFLWRYSMTETGKQTLSELKLSVPYVGKLYRQLYLSRIADNLSTMLTSGIPMVRAIEVTAEVVDNEVYERVLTESVQAIKAGSSVSDALSKYEEIPGIMSQMIKVGEESGALGTILTTLAKFYRREVSNAVDTLVNMIEPVMIVMLALGVGVLLASVLMPIYNISSAI